MSGYKPFTINIWITACVVLLMALGCDKGQQMLSPVISDTPVVEDTTDTNVESPIADIFDDIELSPEPTIPTDTNLLESDNVFHTTHEEIKQVDEEYWDVVLVSTSTEAYENEKVINFFNEVKERAEKYCGKNESTYPPEMTIYFSNRDERDTFKNLLTGTWTTSIHDEGKWWYLHEAVGIVESKDIYYTLHITASWDACVFRN